MKALLAILVLGLCRLVLGQNITNVPICAQTCLANATEYQTECTGIDVKCLCTNSAYVNALSCCLASACTPPDQQRAIAFNMASCASVNESAPNFVGCAPGVSSSLLNYAETALSSTSASTTNSFITTVTGPIESALTTFIGDVPTTAAFNGRPLLGGTCSQPYFAQITDRLGTTTQFPHIGCSREREACCPFDSYQNALLSKCPLDYITTSNACCPSGWQIYFTDIGGQTPCYTIPTVTYVPASPTTGSGSSTTTSGLTVITEYVFARKFQLSERAINPPRGLSGGAIGGIAAGSVAAFTIAAFMFFYCLQRRRVRRTPQRLPMTEGGGEMVVASPATATAELASPQNLPNSPGSGRSAWISPSSPPAYEHNADPQPKPMAVAQELPGSTFIYEHHPAFSAQENESANPAPSSRPRTPVTTPPHSPQSKGASSPLVISPLGSPKLR